jgi:hypothetical protein
MGFSGSSLGGEHGAVGGARDETTSGGSSWLSTEGTGSQDTAASALDASDHLPFHPESTGLRLCFLACDSPLSRVCLAGPRAICTFFSSEETNSESRLRLLPNPNSFGVS